ncbi:MAG: hypothetical protein ABI237_05930 [Ginsengibacter sp.]
MKAVSGWGLFTLIAAIIAKRMDWKRFRKTDEAKEGKVDAETALERISAEVKISDAALQWTVNLAARLEQANVMIDKKQAENDRLHEIIDVMKTDFDRQVQKLKEDFNKRIKQLEQEFHKSRQELIDERESNREEIKRLKTQINNAAK